MAIAPAAPSTDEVLATIRVAVDDGRDLAHVERMIDRLALDRDHRDALALYARGYHSGQAKRRRPAAGGVAAGARPSSFPSPSAPPR